LRRPAADGAREVDVRVTLPPVSTKLTYYDLPKDANLTFLDFTLGVRLSLVEFPGGGSAAVPEPAASAMLLTGVLLSMFVRRHRVMI
jgi:hypothetical protein